MRPAETTSVYLVQHHKMEILEGASLSSLFLSLAGPHRSTQMHHTVQGRTFHPEYNEECIYHWKQMCMLSGTVPGKASGAYLQLRHN